MDVTEREQLRQARARRHNQAVLQQQVIPSDFNDPFKYRAPVRRRVSSVSARPAGRASGGAGAGRHADGGGSDHDDDDDDDDDEGVNHAYNPYGDDDNDATSAGDAPRGIGGRKLALAITATLYQYTSATSATAIGPRSVALVGSTGSSGGHALVVSDTARKTQFLTVPIDANFKFTLVAPDDLPAALAQATASNNSTGTSTPMSTSTCTVPPVARFSDGLNTWLVLFAQTPHLADFALNIALARNAACHRARPGTPRAIIAQDLCLLAPPAVDSANNNNSNISSSSALTSAPPVRIGDKVRIRYSMQTVSADGGALGPTAIACDLTKVFDVGTGVGAVPSGVEQGILGMRKGGVRFLVIPAVMAEAADDWGPHVPTHVDLAVEVTLEKHKSINATSANTDAAAADPVTVTASTGASNGGKASATSGASVPESTSSSSKGAAAGASSGRGAKARRSYGYASSSVQNDDEDDGQSAFFDAEPVSASAAVAATSNAAKRRAAAAAAVAAATAEAEAEAAAAAEAEASVVAPVPLPVQSSPVPEPDQAAFVAPLSLATNTSISANGYEASSPTAAVTPAAAADSAEASEAALRERMRKISAAAHAGHHAMPSAGAAGAAAVAAAAATAMAAAQGSPGFTAVKSPSGSGSGSAAAHGHGHAAAYGQYPQGRPSLSGATAFALLSPATTASSGASAAAVYAASGGGNANLSPVAATVTPGGVAVFSRATPVSAVLRYLAMDPFASAFAAHAVDTLDDLLLLEDEDWKLIVPQIGARRKLQLRVGEIGATMNQSQAAAGVSQSRAAKYAIQALAQQQQQQQQQQSVAATASATAAVAAAAAANAAANEVEAAGSAVPERDTARIDADAYDRGRADVRRLMPNKNTRYLTHISIYLTNMIKSYLIMFSI